MKYRLLDTGRILVIPCSKTITRERQKLKKIAEMEKNGLRPEGTVINLYKSWKGTMKKYNCYNKLNIL